MNDSNKCMGACQALFGDKAVHTITKLFGRKGKSGFRSVKFY